AKISNKLIILQPSFKAGCRSVASTTANGLPNYYSTPESTIVSQNLCAKFRVRFPTKKFMDEFPYKFSTTDHEFYRGKYSLLVDTGDLNSKLDHSYFLF